MPYVVLTRAAFDALPPDYIDETLDASVTRFAEKADALTARETAGPDHVIAFAANHSERYNWARRESRRFEGHTASSTKADSYIRVPWSGVSWEQDPQMGYFTDDARMPHLSLKRPGMIAFTESHMKGHEDRQTILAPGRYLERYAPPGYYNSADVDRMCGEIKAVTAENFKLARTPEDIETVYLNGPSSCMATDDFADTDGMHPTAVYGNSDLAVAYLGEMTNASARAVCWPDRKIFGRLYGNISLLAALLEADGWTKGSLAGARIRRIEVGRNGSRILMPYIDGPACAASDVDSGQWITLSEHGAFDLQTTDGYIGGETYYCGHCDERISCDQSEDCGYCSRCEDRRWTCGRCDAESFDTDEQNYVGGEYLCNDCAAEDQSECAIDGCGETWHEDNLPRSRRQSRQRNRLSDVCPDCETDTWLCDHCDTYQSESDNPDTCGDCDRPRYDATLTADLPLADTPQVDATPTPLTRPSVHAGCGCEPCSTTRGLPDYHVAADNESVPTCERDEAYRDSADAHLPTTTAAEGSPF